MVTKVNDFPTNKREAERKLRPFLDPLYARLTNKGYYHLFDYDDINGRMHQQHGADAEHDNYKRSRRLLDEHKLVQYPENGEPLWRFCMETWSCTLPGKWSDGWMYTSIADNLFYGFEIPLFPVPVVDMFLIYTFQEVKRWFWQQDLTRYDITTQKTENKTRSVLVPIADIVRAFPETKRVFLTEKSCVVIPAPLENIMTIRAKVKKYQLTGECGEDEHYIAQIEKALTIASQESSDDEKEQAMMDSIPEQLPIW